MNTSISITINMDGNTEKHGLLCEGENEDFALQRIRSESASFYRHKEYIYI